ncbi:hypothetical protein AUJ68_03835 [Candidatus Woesearchaeota archaeon CG1_02_57_44]|nr:MAG: hypothetical protein AUJ68_03835 [Candidatus Woesearchaeota archaeon CG1_02_57_44]PIN69201.1 MAG: hypothetical protein COV94_03190 [Candidatus Woesearchaeota archaeon CG11_big_fil_rev_8_21_14_0_20_57_5]
MVAARGKVPYLRCSCQRTTDAILRASRVHGESRQQKRGGIDLIGNNLVSAIIALGLLVFIFAGIARLAGIFFNHGTAEGTVESFDGMTADIESYLLGSGHDGESIDSPFYLDEKLALVGFSKGIEEARFTQGWFGLDWETFVRPSSCAADACLCLCKNVKPFNTACEGLAVARQCLALPGIQRIVARHVDKNTGASYPGGGSYTEQNSGRREKEKVLALVGDTWGSMGGGLSARARAFTITRAGNDLVFTDTGDQVSSS